MSFLQDKRVLTLALCLYFTASLKQDSNLDALNIRLKTYNKS